MENNIEYLNKRIKAYESLLKSKESVEQYLNQQINELKFKLSQLSTKNLDSMYELNAILTEQLLKAEEKIQRLELKIKHLEDKYEPAVQSYNIRNC